MFGNPGAGKSTLLNLLLKKLVFQSGLSIGDGITQKLGEYEENGVIYCDTPGLADIAMIKEAADEIEKSLKRDDCEFRLFFVITLEASRLRPEDLCTIECVMNILPKKTPFSLIINKLSSNALEYLGEKGKEGLLKLSTALNNNSVLFLEEEKELFDKFNAIIPPPPQLKEFVDKAPRAKFSAKDVGSLKIGDFDEKKKEKEKLIQTSEWHPKIVADNPSQKMNSSFLEKVQKIQQILKEIWEGIEQWKNNKSNSYTS